MALLRCLDCTTAFAVGLHRCPQCTGTRCEEDGAMPKIHKDRPPTYETDIPAEQIVEPEAEVEPAPAPRKRASKSTRPAPKPAS